MRRTPKQRARLFRLIQVVSFVVVAFVGAMIFSARGFAQGPKPLPKGAATAGIPIAAGPVGSAPPKPSATAKAPPKAAPTATLAIASASAAPKAPSPAASSAPTGDAGAGDAEAPLDYAEVQTEADFPKEMSEEERNAIGTGKVPIHREGPFRSPFAHPHFGGPTKAKVGLVIQEIREFNIQTGSFEAEFFLSITGDKDLPKIDPSFTNGHEVEAKAIADTPTFKLYHVSGKFTSPVDLRQYPFDTQKLVIEFEDQTAGVDQIVFEADKSRTSLDEGFNVASFGVASIGAHAYKHAYPARFDRDDLYISRYKFELGLDRFATSAAFSVYIPAYIIVIISLIGLWVPPDELEVRSNAGAPMLAAAVLFHFSLIQSLPATGYLTRADKLMLGVYVALLLNMLTTWGFLIVSEENIDLWFKRFRLWTPPATVLIMLISSIS
ncbi:MAG: hypothetical protein U0174_25525 [Polyangiaceae bacterium]